MNRCNQVRPPRWIAAVNRCAAAAIGVAVAALYCGAAAAQAIQFRDRTFEIGVNFTSETRDLVDGSSSPGDPSPTVEWIEAVNGKLVWATDAGACGVSLVYLPGRGNSGKVDCPPRRTGTASQWNERSSTSSFQTTARLDGNVLTLHGELRGTKYFSMNSCGTLRASSTTQVTVLQDLKLKIAGETCQVLELSEVDIEEETGTINGRPRHEITRMVRQLPPTASCKIMRRSDPGPPPQPLRDPYVPC
jgi:hypothetical protein